MTEQLGLGLDEPEAPHPGTAHEVRLELNALVDAVRPPVEELPWDMATARHLRTSFPLKAKILPPDEARFLWMIFDKHLDRLGVPATS